MKISDGFYIEYKMDPKSALNISYLQGHPEKKITR